MINIIDEIYYSQEEQYIKEVRIEGWEKTLETEQNAYSVFYQTLTAEQKKLFEDYDLLRGNRESEEKKYNFSKGLKTGVTFILQVVGSAGDKNPL